MAKATKVTVTTEKPEGFGLSDKGPGKAPQIRHNRPEVAKHCARMIIAHNMDTEAAVAKMLSVDYPDATDAQIVSWRAPSRPRRTSSAKWPTISRRSVSAIRPRRN
jgi:hypothetical protein